MALPPLSLEPVPSTSTHSTSSVVTTPAAQPISSSSHSALLRPPPELKDVSLEGELVYDTTRNQQPLSERLARLWAERGDFARLDYAKLREDAEALGEGGEGEKEVVDWALPRVDEEKDAEAEEGKGKEKSKKTDLTQGEMEVLKGQMWRKLHEAHHALYMSHSLVSLLLHSKPSTRAAPSSRADSPAVGGSSSGQPRAPGSMGRGVSSAPPGTQAAILEELGLEGSNIGVSSLSLRNTTGMQSTNGRADEGAEEAEEGEEEDGETPRYRAQKEAARLARADAALTAEEAETRARALVGTQHSAKQGIRKAIAVLNAGAEQLRRVLPPSAGGGEAGEAEMRRWEGLREARLNGWGVTPGTTGGTLRQQQREDGARDAWVGWAVPEAQPRYKYQALAFFSPTLSAPVAPASVAVDGAAADPDAMAIDEPVSATGLAAAAAAAGNATNAPAHGLVFIGRPYKRLRASFVHKADDGTETVWSSDAPTEESGEKDASGVDAELRKAQEEQADVELFLMLISEARTLTKAAHVYSTVSQSSVSLEVNLQTSLRFELISTSDASERPSKPLPARARRDKAKLETTEEEPRKAALARLLLAYMRIGLVQRYRERAAGSAGKTRPERPRAPLLEPVLGLVHYASFVTSLREALTTLTKEAKVAASFTLAPLDSVSSVRKWALPLLQGRGDEATAALGGVATLRLDSNIIAKLDISFPSNITLHLPLRRTAGGTRGVVVPSLTLDSTLPLLKRELDDLSQVAA